MTPTAIVESLYKSVPETNKFTRSLSNPEMVKKIQQDRLKQKFIKISTKEGGMQMKFPFHRMITHARTLVSIHSRWYNESLWRCIESFDTV